MHLFFKKIFSVLILAVSLNAIAVPLQWQTLAPGLEYTKINSFFGLPGRCIHAFRFDLQNYQLQLAFAKDQHNIAASVASLVIANNAVVGVNGGFFSPELQPLGLRINNGQVRNPLKYTPWWGVFFTQGAHAYVVAQNSFKPNKSINFAVQSGPRLVVNGKIPPLKSGLANRTALGITKDGQVILLVTDNFPLQTVELAKIMSQSAKEGGLNCVDALNLDGGSSTQLYATLKDFSLDVPSFAPVADAVLVVPRKN